MVIRTVWREVLGATFREDISKLMVLRGNDLSKDLSLGRAVVFSPEVFFRQQQRALKLEGQSTILENASNGSGANNLDVQGFKWVHRGVQIGAASGQEGVVLG